MKYYFNLTMIFIFIIFLSISFIGFIIGANLKEENTEWRKLAEFPKINSNMQPKYFPKKFEQFFNDNFGFRNILLRINATISLQLFDKSSVMGVTKTGGKWYFHNEARFIAPNYKIFYDHIIFSDKQLSAIGDFFLVEKKWLDEQKIPYLFVVIPDKEIIYPEFFPYQGFANSKIQLSQILKTLNEREVPTLYLEPQILEAKRKMDNTAIYWKEDTHWNFLGAFIGYQAVINRIKDYFPNTEGLQLSDFDISVNSEMVAGYDLNRLKSLIKSPDKANDLVLKFKIKEGAINKINKIDKVIIYGDSYFIGDPAEYIGGSMYFLKYNFNKMLLTGGPLGAINKEEMKKEKPDLFIREIIQRNVYKFYTSAGTY